MVVIKRQAGLLALMTALFLLAGCGQSPAQLEENFAAWKDAFSAQAEHDITADITGHIDDRESEYTLFYHCGEDGETVQVIAPELIADITAHIEKEETRLSFDGIMLETGAGIGQKLSPLTALPVFMDFIREGHVESVWTEKAGETEFLTTELELPDSSKMTLWQNEKDMSPLYAAIRTGSSVEIKIKITDIT